MSVSPSANDLKSGRFLRGLFFIALGVGVFFRFYHLDHKVYWDDEIYSAIRILGYSEAQVDVRASRAADARALQQLIHPARTDERQPVLNTVTALAVEEPQHAPLYYVLAHGWSKLLGTSVAAVRSLSAVAGLLALPCMYWLCFELYGSSVAGWIGAALLAVAPVEVIYSQEAREYSLWTVAIVALSGAFLRATRLGRAGPWRTYAVLLALALYVYPLSALVAFGHLIFSAFAGRPRRWEALRGPLLATAAAVAAFVPWMWLIVRNLGQVDRSMATILGPKVSPVHVLRAGIGLVRLDFIDLNIARSASLNALLSLLPLAVTGYALYVICRRYDRRTWSFVVVALLATTVPLVLPDLVSHGMRTSNPRYFMPLYVFLDVALAGFVWALLAGQGGHAPRRALATMVFVAVLAGRVASCAVSSQAETWWNKFDERSIALARTIDASQRPTLTSDAYVGYALSVAEYLAPEVGVRLRPQCYLCASNGLGALPPASLPSAGLTETIFALGPSPALQAQLAQTARERPRTLYRCIDVRGNCTSPLRLW